MQGIYRGFETFSIGSSCEQLQHSQQQSARTGTRIDNAHRPSRSPEMADGGKSQEARVWHGSSVRPTGLSSSGSSLRTGYPIVDCHRAVEATCGVCRLVSEAVPVIARFSKRWTGVKGSHV